MFRNQPELPVRIIVRDAVDELRHLWAELVFQGTQAIGRSPMAEGTMRLVLLRTLDQVFGGGLERVLLFRGVLGEIPFVAMWATLCSNALGELSLPSGNQLK